MCELLARFTCSITQQLAYEPVVCPDGHLFDHPAILRWLELSSTCPIDRSYLQASNLIRLRMFDGLDSFIRPSDSVLPTAATNSQTVDEIQQDFDFAMQLNNNANMNDDVPDLIPAFDASNNDTVTIPLPRFMANRRGRTVQPLFPVIPEQTYDDAPTFVGMSVGSNGYFSDFFREEIFDNPAGLSVRRNFAGDLHPDYILPARTFHVTSDSFNSNSSNLHLAPLVRSSNQSYVIRKMITGRFATYTAYVYHSSLTLENAARQAAQRGYFVYDFFSIGNGVYVIYTFTRRLNGTRVSLRLH